MSTTSVQDSSLFQRLQRETTAEVRFDEFSRGLYSTDASIYQIKPLGVVVPKTEQDVLATLSIANDAGVSVTMRGAGTSQCGQTVGEGLIVDVSKHLHRLISVDPETRVVVVQPGIVLDQLNAQLKPHGLFFPVDVSTSSRATIGGMTANNSCGARSIRYGKMVDNVRAVDGVLADGNRMHFGEWGNGTQNGSPDWQKQLVSKLLDLGTRESAEVARRFPKVQRRVGGYNLDVLTSEATSPLNLAHLLVGSEGTLAVSTEIELHLQPIPEHKVLGVCHFPTFYEAMATTQHLVELGPDAVELVDQTMLELAAEIPQFQEKLKRFVKGKPGSLLLVEFAGAEFDTLKHKLRDLDELMAAHGFPDAVVEAIDPEFQKQVWDVRKSGLNIMMSMKGDGKPVSCIEDCAVELTDLAEYTSRLNELFAKYGTTGTWYAHASVGCLHVRPVLNLKQEMDARKLRAITEETFAIVREYKGSHSGEHGDGLVRSEFHEIMYGKRLVKAFEEIKRIFDPSDLLNPGKIVQPSKMDDRRLFRYSPDYQQSSLSTGLDWSEWGGIDRAVEMCNNNGACRKFNTEVMCPSYRVTRDERHLTRGRANALRLALSGQLGPEALTSKDMYETMRLCVGCKACRRECPTGVDMNRMKTEFLHHYHQKNGLSLRERLFAYMPRYAPLAAKLGGLANLRDVVPGLSQLSEKLLGLTSKRELPQWDSQPFCPEETSQKTTGPEVVLFADSFNTYFEPQVLRDGLAVLEAAGRRVIVPEVKNARRKLCCGRTFLSSGLIDEAKREATLLLESLTPYVERGVPIVGLEPSCVFTIKDELPVLIPGEPSKRLAEHVQLLEEYLVTEKNAGRLNLKFRATGHEKVLLHGHCHQKAFDAVDSTVKLLESVPGIEVETIPSSCCGMAGSFGYQAEHYEVSMEMAELSLLPRVRQAKASEQIAACGTSCRHQIEHGSGRSVRHPLSVLRHALAD